MARRQASDIENLDIKWHVLRLIWPYLMEFRLRTALAMGCLVLAKLSSIFLPFILKYLVDDFESQLNSLGGAVGPETQGTDATTLLVVPVALILAYGLARFVNVIFNELRDTLFGRVTERTIRRLSLKTFRHLHNLDLAFHLDRRTGGLSRDIERGNSGISFLMRFMVFNILPTVLELLIWIAVFLSSYGPSFALTILGSIVCYVSFSVVVTERRNRYVREMNLADSTTNTRAVDSLLNYETVKYFTNEDYETALYDRDLAQWEVAKRKNRLSLFALNGGQALIVALSMTAMLLLAARGVASGAMTLGDFVLVNSVMMQLFIPLNFLGFVYREIKGALANIERMFDLLKQRPAVVETDNPQALPTNNPGIRFHEVDFAYASGRSILEQLSFTVAPGERVAVVGPSGAGKSTLVKLLFRFYDCSGGRIEVGGVDIRQLSLKALRGNIGVVPQDAVLFNDSLLENIRYGNPEASDAAVQEAIRLAHLDGFVASLPAGWQTQVGERGLKLSGGEKQRVAIARTLLKRPAILVFDEATSSLDSRTEKGIVDAIREVSKGHTSLVIAHRLSTIVDADRILVLDKGRLVEWGSHTELLSEQGLYAHMWAVQQQEAHAEIAEASEASPPVA